MSQETIETATEEQLLGVEQPEDQPVEPEPEPEAPEPQAKQEDRVPVSELINERHARQRLEEEVHALRMAHLQAGQAMAPRAPERDPVDVAMERLVKSAGWDDAMNTVMGPALRPLLQEIAYLREMDERKNEEFARVTQQIQALSERDRLANQNQQLAQMIPDLDKVGPLILDHLKDMPDAVKQTYAANPQLLIPLANALRASNGVATPKSQRGTQAARAATALDTGAAPSAPLTLDAPTLASMRPGSKEFEAVRRDFWGGDV